MHSWLENKISVIIPVYNAAEFVATAVASALILKEVKEVLLIEDGSTDDSLKICKALKLENNKISLFTHPNNENKGAGASRNLGIEHAKGDFIAFLDADDFYLADRFKAEKTIFETQSDIDGVYGALGFHYYSQEGKLRYEENSFGQLTTLSGKPTPDELFLALAWRHPKKIHGYFSVVALTLRREVFNGKAEKFGLLKMHEDTVFIVQLSLNCRLEAGIIDRPVALRGVHDNNRIVNDKRPQDWLLMWTEVYNWAKAKRKSSPVVKQLEAFKVAEQLTFASTVRRIPLWIKASLSNKYFLADSELFATSTRKTWGNKLGAFICFIKDKVRIRIIKTQDKYYIHV